MKKSISLSIVLSISIALSGCSAAVSYEVTKAKEEQFTSQYIKEHPESIPFINRYIDCKNGKESAVEGCAAHVVKNDEEKEVLMKYLKAKEQHLYQNK